MSSEVGAYARGHPLSYYVRDTQAEVTIGKLDEVVEVAAQKQRRIVHAAELQPGVRYGQGRKHAALDVTGRFDLPSHALGFDPRLIEAGMDDG